MNISNNSKTGRWFFLILHI